MSILLTIAILICMLGVVLVPLALILLTPVVPEDEDAATRKDIEDWGQDK
ncbi:MAG: hypothetical protein WCK77_23165 [Verrucomicrobiota bacterium]